MEKVETRKVEEFKENENKIEESLATEEHSENLNKSKTVEKKSYKFDEIKTILGLPEFKGVKVYEHPLYKCKFTIPPTPRCDENGASALDHIPDFLLRNKKKQGSVLTPYGDIDFASFQPHTSSDFKGRVTKNDGDSENAYKTVMQLDPEVLSGYEEYLRLYSGTQFGFLRVTQYGTLSLTLADIQVDITIDGAIRIVNPKAYIAMAIDPNGNNVAVMHPMGRVRQDVSVVNIMAYDINHGSHKYAKLWQEKALFRSKGMSVAYVMDAGGTRTTLTSVPQLPDADITLPVFYGSSKHGKMFRGEADKIYKLCTKRVDRNGHSVWQINDDIVIKYKNGEVKVYKHKSNVFLRTSAVTGIASIATEQIHCAASQGDSHHLFVRFGSSKMYFNGNEFKIRTLSQAAGMNGDGKITIY